MSNITRSKSTSFLKLEHHSFEKETWYIVMSLLLVISLPIHCSDLGLANITTFCRVYHYSLEHYHMRGEMILTKQTLKWWGACILCQSKGTMYSHSVHFSDKQAMFQCTRSVQQPTWSHTYSMPLTRKHVSWVFFMSKAGSSTTASSLYYFKEIAFCTTNLYNNVLWPMMVPDVDEACGYHNSLVLAIVVTQ